MTAAYSGCWTRFMSYHTGRDQEPNITFSQEEILSVTPEDICAFMCLMAYGKEHPDENDKPTLARSSTLEYYKKAISKFMPRRMIQWDDVRREGNPTKSVQVNDRIKEVRKCEVRHQGVKSAARRELEYNEFMGLLALVRKDRDRLHAQRLVAVLVTQWQLIGRIDDMMKLKFCNFTFSAEHSLALFVKMRWSKNITEEREAPEQVLLGSMDANVCVLLNMAIYVELLYQSMGASLSNTDFIFSGGSRSVSASFTKAFTNSEFVREKPGPLGTHSVRKGAASYASKNGLAKDTVERRGRWRNDKGVVNRYITTTLPFPDAVASAMLTGPSGPIRYGLKPTATFITTTLLVESIAPGVNALLGQRIARILALPLVWAAHTTTDEMDAILPESLKEKIVKAIAVAGGGMSANPVDRVPIHVSGEAGMVRFLDLGVSHDDADVTRSSPSLASTSAAPGAIMRELACANGEIRGLKRRFEELHIDTTAEIARLRGDLMARLDNMHRSLKRIAIQPVIRPAERETPAPSQTAPAMVKLPKCPRDLYILWQEYEFGRAGVKPAKLFTAVERGASKSAYCRRKIFWDMVVSMVRRGYTSDAAVARIYSVYGRGCTVTEILNKMRADRPHGGHAELA